MGVTGELLTLFAALPEVVLFFNNKCLSFQVAQKKHYTLEMPNVVNMGISFWWVLIFAAISYIPGDS